MTISAIASTDLSVQTLTSLTRRPAVRISVDGVNLLSSVDVDRIEHQRRLALGVGAVTALGLLHSLWLLPRGLPVPEEQIPSRRLRALLDAPQLATQTPEGLERTYEPPATVHSVAFSGTRPDRLVERAIRFTPIYERWVLLEDAGLSATSADLALASKWGVGVAKVTADKVHPIVMPMPSVLGQPAVYRWWLGELSYAAWLQSNTQLVN